MSNNITGQVTEKLVEAFEFFNQELDTNLDTPVFTLIPNRGRQSYYGWYWQGRWKDGKKTLPEINITADTLKRSVEDICETIIHEMVHYKNNVEEIVDCNANQYHNKHFKTRAESFGLKVEKMKNKGYAKTALDEKASNLVKKYKNKYCKDDKNPFHVYRVSEERVSIVKKNGKRFIAIDGRLASEAEDTFPGQTIRQTVENLLRAAISEGTIDRIKELEEMS
jgi:SprT-like family